MSNTRRLVRLILLEKYIDAEELKYLDSLGFPDKYVIEDSYYSGSIFDYVSVLHYLRYHYPEYSDKEKMMSHWLQILPNDFVERLEGWFWRKVQDQISKLEI